MHENDYEKLNKHTAHPADHLFCHLSPESYELNKDIRQVF